MIIFCEKVPFCSIKSHKSDICGSTGPPLPSLYDLRERLYNSKTASEESESEYNYQSDFKKCLRNVVK